MKLDAIVVGGGFAGLAAATYLARGRATVCVVDTRQPRNRFAHASHGFLGYDGSDPQLILATAREQLAAYPTVQMIESEATKATANGNGFSVALRNGQQMEARKLILAFGLRDTLPAIHGLQERWGKTVLHCPYCHGIEFSDRRLGCFMVRQCRSIRHCSSRNGARRPCTSTAPSSTRKARRS